MQRVKQKPNKAALPYCCHASSHMNQQTTAGCSPADASRVAACEAGPYAVLTDSCVQMRNVLAHAGGCAGDRSRADWARRGDTPAPAWFEGLATGGPGGAVTHAQHFHASLSGFQKGFDMRSCHAVSMQGLCGLVVGIRSAKPHAAMCRSRVQEAWPAQTSRQRASCSTWVDT